MLVGGITKITPGLPSMRSAMAGPSASALRWQGTGLELHRTVVNAQETEAWRGPLLNFRLYAPWRYELESEFQSNNGFLKYLTGGQRNVRYKWCQKFRATAQLIPLCCIGGRAIPELPSRTRVRTTTPLNDFFLDSSSHLQ